MYTDPHPLSYSFQQFMAARTCVEKEDWETAVRSIQESVFRTHLMGEFSQRAHEPGVRTKDMEELERKIYAFFGCLAQSVSHNCSETAAWLEMKNWLVRILRTISSKKALRAREGDGELLAGETIPSFPQRRGTYRVARLR